MAMYPQITDQQVVAVLETRQLSGRVAVEGLYDLYADRIFRYLLARIGDLDLADELTTEVFIRAMRYLPTYRPDPDHPAAALSAWLYRIAATVLANHRRTQSRRPQTCELEEWQASSQTPAPWQRAAEAEELAALARAISKLNEDQRQVIVAKFGEEMSNAEIGHMLGKSEGAIKSLQHRALRTLARLLHTDNTRGLSADEQEEGRRLR